MFTRKKVFIISPQLLLLCILLYSQELYAITPIPDYLTHEVHFASLSTPPICSWEDKVAPVISKLYPNMHITQNNQTLSCATPNVISSVPYVSYSIINTKHINAFVVDTSNAYPCIGIVLTAALLSHITSESELAFVIAHEVSHWQNGDINTIPTNLILSHTQAEHMFRIRQQKEYEADALASKTLMQAGFDLQDGNNFLKKLSSILPQTNEKLDNTYTAHPSLASRASRLKSQT